MEDEKLAERSFELGKIFLSEMKKLNPEVVEKARGKGLMNAIIIKPTDRKLRFKDFSVHFLAPPKYNQKLFLSCGVKCTARWTVNG